MTQRRLILVDGLASLYRSFYAIRDLSTADGRPTNAVYGVVRMLGQLREQWAPTHWAVVFDGGRPEERLALQPEYKAQRPDMPDPLRAQIAVVEDYLDRAGIRWVRSQGQEADDVIASIAAELGPQAGEVLIVTNDKDLYQVVQEGVRIVANVGKGVVMGAAEVEEKTGVGPSRIVEWLALVGDTADNIPGVPGVGAKTAAKLLGEFGSVESLFARLPEIPSQKLRESLEASREIVTRNMDLVRLNTELGTPFSLEELSVKPADPARLLPFLEDLEFESLARDLREPDLFG